jgi:hypothetical protein
MGSRLSFARHSTDDAPSAITTHSVITTRVSKSMVIVHGPSVHTARIVCGDRIFTLPELPGSVQVTSIQRIKNLANVKVTIVGTSHGAFMVRQTRDSTSKEVVIKMIRSSPPTYTPVVV